LGINDIINILAFLMINCQVRPFPVEKSDRSALPQDNDAKRPFPEAIFLKMGAS
jgi:hypothetical protein